MTEEKVSNQITITNTRSQIKEELPITATIDLDQQLSFHVDGYLHSYRYRSGNWDGKRHLYNRHSQTFPTGLLSKVTTILQQHHIRFSLDDRRTIPDYGSKISLRKIKLRPYQQEVLTAMTSAERGVIKCCTGSGKTAMIAALIAHYNVPTIIYVTTKDLLYQMKDNLSEYIRLSIGQIGDGKVILRKVTVSTIQSAVKYTGTKYKAQEYESSEDIDNTFTDSVQQTLNEAQMIIFDECHHVRAESLQTIAKYSTNAYYRWGASATPFREEDDDLLIEAQLGNTAIEIPASRLIEEKYLVPATITYLYCGRSDQRGQYQKIYKEHIVHNDKRNGMVCDVVEKLTNEKRPTLVLVHERDEHGQQLCEMLTQRNIPTMFVHGLLNSSTRSKLLTRMRKGEVACCILTSLGDEGLDLPPVSGLVLAGAGKSRTKILQRVGRALRPYEGKQDAQIYDFIDDHPYLLDHSIQRIITLKTEPLFKVRIAINDRVKEIISQKRRLKQLLKERSNDTSNSANKD